MSLFKAREWWRVNCGHNEEYDQGSLCVANIDNDPSGRAKIITGSFQGYLRIYMPKEREYKIEDLMLEIELEQAILQLEAGRFSANGGMQLAVLHPRKLVVYQVAASGTSFLQLTKLYEHFLEHTAANMAMGSFGGVTSGADYLCVQSYDGQLSFFEQESFAFSRFLPNFLIPGPLCYCEFSDAFITCSAAFELECYKYKVLAAASGEKQAAQNQTQGNLLTAKKLQVDWKLILGEAAIDIRVGKVTKAVAEYNAHGMAAEGGCDIIVLGEHTIFCISTRGEITLQKRLEYHPACCTTYAVPGPKATGGLENLLVVTHTKAALVYRESMLMWAAKTETQPISVRVAEVGGVKGMVVTLDDMGDLVVSYLGTDPPVNAVGYVESKELDYEEMDAEHRRLLAIIREANSNQRKEPSDKLTIRAQGTEEAHNDDSLLEGSMLSPSTARTKVSITLVISYFGNIPLHDVTLVVKPPEPVTVDEGTFHFPEINIGEEDSASVIVNFMMGADCLPINNVAQAIASYATETGEPRTVYMEVQLPMNVFCRVIPPVKNAEFKITVSTNRSPPQLTDVFEEMMGGGSNAFVGQLTSNQAANVCSFKFFSGQDVTILVSKTAGRYRVQSDSFEAMWLVLDELCRRLTRYYGELESSQGVPAEGAMQITYDESLPMQDFFEIVDSHFGARMNVITLQKELALRAQQFVSIQRRLLVRFKDANPAPLSHLDVILEETYNELQQLGNDMETAQTALKGKSRQLAAAVQLILQLIKYRFNLNPSEFSLLKGHITPEIIDCGEVGWEECTEAAMTNLLRTALAKNAKEAAAPLPALNTGKDTVKLKKHMSLVLERLAHGMKLTKPEAEGTGKKSKKEAAANGAA